MHALGETTSMSAQPPFQAVLRSNYLAEAKLPQFRCNVILSGHCVASVWELTMCIPNQDVNE